MADQKISQLTEKQTLVGNDIITILDSEDSNANKKAKVSAVDTLVSTYTGTAPIDITSKVVSIATANTNTNGALTSTDWNTFNGKQDAITASAPLDLTSNTLTIATADATTTGALSSTDWSTFNSKANAQQVIADTENTTATLTLASNTLYTFSEPLTSLTISSLASGTFENEIQFTAGEEFTLTAEALAGKWLGFDEPTFTEGKTYIIKIKNGYGITYKVGA